jgi:gamma-glutamyltranspeptidase/glutathione hydrolase
MGWHAESKTGAIAAGGAGAVAAGMSILEMGGNAADAAAATVLALNVTDHGACSIGGEAPMILFEAKTKQTHVICGMGSAPRSKDAIDWYMKHGIPPRHDIKIAPVPSVVDLCTTVLQRYGTKSFEQIVTPAIALLGIGSEPFKPKLAATLHRLVEAERSTSGSREEKIQAASDEFYGRKKTSGDVAADLEADYIEKGGFLRRADLAAHKTRIEKPVTASYRGHTVCKCGPWTQGPMLLQALLLLEGFGLKAMGHLSPDYIHVVIEAIKLAMADRDEYYGDPDFVHVPMAKLLSDEYTALRRPLIVMQQASMDARPGDPIKMAALKGGGQFRPGVGGTTTCVIADRWGNVVSVTPSANVEAFDGGRTGVTYSNRLVSLNTVPGHPNCIQPGKRPRITLTPTMVLKEGKPILAISVAGGDLQDQATLNLLLDFVDFGMDVESAVTAPRFATHHHQDSFNPTADRAKAFLKAGSLAINSTVGTSVREDLAGRGHAVDVVTGAIANPVMLHIDHASGTFHAAGDPAAKRHAAGL